MTDRRTSGTGARDVVEMFSLSGDGLPAREDVEVASQVLFDDPDRTLTLFDATIDIRQAERSDLTHLHADFDSVRSLFLERIGDHPISADALSQLSACVGGEFSDECLKRLEAAGEDTALRNHLLHTAADHYAHDVINGLGNLLGRHGRRIDVSLPSDFDIQPFAQLPYLCFLVPAEEIRD